MLDDMKHDDRVERARLVVRPLERGWLHIQAKVRASKVGGDWVRFHAADLPALPSKAFEEHACVGADLEQLTAGRQETAQLYADGLIIWEFVVGADYARARE